MNHQDKLFIINKLSGNDRNRSPLIDAIKRNFKDATIAIIKEKNEFNPTIDFAKSQKFNSIIINGGDGTINSFLPVIIETKKVLGIIPSGSGNGLARTLGIPLNPLEALTQISQFKPQHIDVGKVKILTDKKIIEKYFVCAVGLGIDANMADRFEKQNVRGLTGYILAGIKELFSYKPVKAKIRADNQSIRENTYTILSVMNIPQYGNDFYIVPSALVNDGFLNLVLLEKMSIWTYPYVGLNFLMKREKKPVHYLKAKNIVVEILSDNVCCHIDGEPYKETNISRIEIEVMPSAISILM